MEKQHYTRNSTCPFVPHGRATSSLEQKNMFNCCVSFCLATTFCVVSTVLLVSSRRSAMPCLAASCPIKQHHGRYSQSAARVLKTRCGGAPRHINLRTTRRQYSATRNVFSQETRINTKAATRHPLTPLRNATPAATSEPCPEQLLTTR